MKTIHLYITVLLGLLVSSCNLDNYDSPDSSFYGAVIDLDTNEPILQDMIQGSEIDVIELGYENPNIQKFTFKTDGSFQNSQVFEGKYLVQAIRSNFFPIGLDTISIKGNTEHNFTTRPYIRIKETNITFDEKKGKVIATFKLERVSENAVKTIILMADKNPNVAIGVRTLSVQQNVGQKIDSESVFKLEMPTSSLESGASYYFRIGALIADVSSAKYNFSTAVRLNIDNSNAEP